MVDLEFNAQRSKAGLRLFLKKMLFCYDGRLYLKFKNMLSLLFYSAYFFILSKLWQNSAAQSDPNELQRFFLCTVPTVLLRWLQNNLVRKQAQNLCLYLAQKICAVFKSDAFYFTTEHFVLGIFETFQKVSKYL